jgi:hypothetical protein
MTEGFSRLINPGPSGSVPPSICEGSSFDPSTRYEHPGACVPIPREEQMAHIPQSPVSADEHLLDVVADPAMQGDHLERLDELARTASPECRSSLESTIPVVTQSRQIRSMTLKTVEQGTLLTEAHNMDEERRSLAELHILQERVLK